MEMVEVFAPSRPIRLGTHRRKPRAVSASKVGASRFGAAEAPSLDTKKQPETSDLVFPAEASFFGSKSSGFKGVSSGDVRGKATKTMLEWLNGQITEEEAWGRQLKFHGQLCKTVFGIWQDWRLQAAAKFELEIDGEVQTFTVDDEAQRTWFYRYTAAQKDLDGEEQKDRLARVKKWLKENKPKGPNAEAVKWEKTYFNLANCGKEWVAYKASCCGDRSRMVAVPIGCNHRLCPMCAWHRSQRARVRIKTLFDRLTHPILLTLTVPNKKEIHKRDFEWFRKQVRTFIKAHSGYILGGVYSMETTYNRKDATWHIHAHVLADAAAALPSSGAAKVDFYGARELPFTAMKWRWEFDWLCQWSQDWGKMPPIEAPKKSAKSIRKWCAKWEAYNAVFSRWVHEKREHSNKWAYEWIDKRRVLRADLTTADRYRMAVNTKWSAKHTRVIDVRPVLDREGASREVLKYITKSADFCDLPEAVEQFCNAARGCRLIQTFGTWYGLEIDTSFDPEHMDADLGGLPGCACGVNHWEREGVYCGRDVEMDAAGRWWIKARVADLHPSGTVPRPRIRAADPPEVESDFVVLL